MNQHRERSDWKYCWLWLENKILQLLDKFNEGPKHYDGGPFIGP